MSHGLEAIEGIFLLCSAALHFVGNFAIDPRTGTVSELGTRSLDSEMVFKVQLHSTSDNELSAASRCAEEIWQRKKPEHKSYRISLNKIRVFHKRRYLLRHVAIEVFDTDGGSMFIVCPTNEERDELYNFMWHMHMPACILHMKNSPVITSSRMQVTVTSTPKRVHKRARTTSPGAAPGEGTKLSIPAAFKSFREQLTRSWLDGKLSNFGYLMYLNSLAGRSTNDLTQYPVFPWVLSQYTDETLDLSDPATFRDLSKPMGAMGESRAKDFAARYKELAQLNDPDLAPFHYGTHYSTSGYTLYYLLRLEPFARMGAQLQNGKFDDPSRLFRSIAASWKSASGQNSGTTQDVRELIPEFFYLPEFLVNTNHFSFGMTQSGIKVNDVELPPWAHNSPSEFVRLNRLALESEHVSRNLHNWIDLVFGFKQLGKDAEDAQNVFMALTYEAEVDVDDVEDDVERAAMLSQILNYGQTPSQLFDRPHPRKEVPPQLTCLPTPRRHVGVGFHAGLTGPLIIPGIFPPVCAVKSTVVGQNRRITTAHAVPSSSSWEGLDDLQQEFPVVDMFITQKIAKYVCCPFNAILAPPTRSKYVSFGYSDGSCRFHVAQTTTPKHPHVGSIVSIHEGLHSGKILCAAATNDGSLLITGGEDFTVAVHTFVRINNNSRSLSLLGRLACHKGGVVSITVCEAYGIIVSGSEDGLAIVWDLHRLKLIRRLVCFTGSKQDNAKHAVSTVSCNEKSGEILTVRANEIRLWSVNGLLLARQLIVPLIDVGVPLVVTEALLLPRESWQDGVAVVTGHENGGLCLWSLEYPTDGNVRMSNGVKRKQRNTLLKSPATTSLVFKSDSEKGSLWGLKLMGYVGDHTSPITSLSVTGTGLQTVLGSGDSAGVCIRTTLDLEATIAESELNEVL
jgi:WD40 repeat protein